MRINVLKLTKRWICAKGWVGAGPGHLPCIDKPDTGTSSRS
jgi:hypothetical protein